MPSQKTKGVNLRTEKENSVVVRQGKMRNNVVVRAGKSMTQKIDYGCNGTKVVSGADITKSLE